METIKIAAREALGSEQPFTGPVSVAIWIYRKMPASVPLRDRATIRPTKKPDIDNFVKTALDGCSPLWGDDSQVVLLRAEKHYAQAGTDPRWEINVRSLG